MYNNVWLAISLAPPIHTHDETSGAHAITFGLQPAYAYSMIMEHTINALKLEIKVACYSRSSSNEVLR